MRNARILVPALFAALLATTACGSEPEAQPEAEPQTPLMNPSSPEMNLTAPDSFRVRFETTAGDFVVQVHRDWAPNGADRFYSLVSNGYYDGARFFRVIEGFMAQFGIHADPQVSARWRGARIQDDSVGMSNVRGTITFAQTGQPNSRTTQAFINFGDNSNLDEMGFAPFGRVIEGMDVVDQIHSGYGEAAPRGRGPDQARVQVEGETYLAAEFPELTRIERATVVEG